MSVTAVPLRPIAKGSVAKLWIGLLVLALAAAGAAWWSTAALQTVTLASGVKIRAIRQGSGPTVTADDVAALNYRLHVNSLSAPVVQDSRETGQPFVTTTQTVYPGFAEGLQHMRPGGSYLLWLPPGTGEQGPLPPGAPFTATPARRATCLRTFERARLLEDLLTRVRQLLVLRLRSSSGTRPRASTFALAPRARRGLLRPRPA